MFKIKLPINNYSDGHFFDSDKIINPKRDWNVLVVLFLCMILPAIIFDAYLYRQIVSGDMYVSVNKEDFILENLKINELKKLIQDFDLKEEKVANLQIEKLIDPSI